MFDKNKKKTFIPMVNEDFRDFLKVGIYAQREQFKEANINNDYDTMVKCLQNIKNEITGRVDKKQNIKKVEKIILWYETLSFRYAKKTQAGTIIKYPMDIELKKSKYLNLGYKLLMEELNVLNLI